MAVKKEELIRRYVQAIQEGNAAVFGGAGLSCPSGYVSWKELLRQMATDIDLDVEKETDLLSLAQFYRNRRGNNTSICQKILDTFSHEASENENIAILTRLPIFTYWTTNYDRVIEDGLIKANRNPDVKSESDQLTLIKKNRNAVVYKMHGDVSRPSSAILTKSDYELYELKRPLFRTALKGDLISKVFLFIGFSFDDPNLDFVLSKIRSLLDENVPEHYCFIRRVQKEDFSSMDDFFYSKAKQDLQEENLRTYGIQTVFVNSYDEITEILREIEVKSKRKRIFISGSAQDYNAPWNKGKAEDLAKSLSQALVRDDFRIATGFGLGIGSAVINGALDIIYKEKFKHVDSYLGLRPFPQNIIDKDERLRLWKQYREDILEDTGISIYLFGNKIDQSSGEIIEADGCIQEFSIAKEKKHIIIPIGSTGYAAKRISDEIKANIADYSYLQDSISILDNETDVSTIINIVLDIIHKAQ